MTRPYFAWLPVCGESCQRRVRGLLWLFLLALPAHQYLHFGVEVAQWDLLLFTGVLALVLGLRLVSDLRGRLEITIERLVARGVARLGERSIESVFEEIERHAVNGARLGGVLTAMAMAGAFTVTLLAEYSTQRALLGVAESALGYIAGNVVGRMVSYGRLGWRLRGYGVEIALEPGHVDGVAGLKPVGDYFFRQATIAAIPAIFLALWWFLFPLWPRDYSDWENVYLALLGVAMLVEVLAFLVPVWSFHRIMLAEKRAWLRRADQLSREHSALVQRIDEGAAPADANRVEGMRGRYWTIEDMPTWPVDARTQRRFRLNNLLLFLPLFGDAAKRVLDWNQVLAVVGKLVT